MTYTLSMYAKKPSIQFISTPQPTMHNHPIYIANNPTTATITANKLPFSTFSPPTGAAPLLPLPFEPLPCTKPVEADPAPVDALVPLPLLSVPEPDPELPESGRWPFVPGPAPVRPGTVATSLDEDLEPDPEADAEG